MLMNVEKFGLRQVKTFNKSLSFSFDSFKRDFGAEGSRPTPLALNPHPIPKVFPKEFKVSGVRCGIKKKPDVLDFALWESNVPASGAAVFTTNKVCAAPVHVSRQVLNQHADNIRGIVINAGCANACTGDQGMKDAQETVRYLQSKGINNSLVMSTGVIGQPLNMTKIKNGVDLAYSALKPGVEGWVNASKAIMTTDTVPKLVSESFQLKDGKTFTIAGVAKGAGMIHPNMATMLSVVCSDISIDPALLKKALTYSVARSFNALSIDGDTSTNDTQAVLCNGAANNTKIVSESDPNYLVFQRALTKVSATLAKLIVRDGEGATKFITVSVAGARSYQEAHTVANSICTSSLFKTAMYGQDANWGRILCAAGYSGVDIDSNKVNLWFVNEKETDNENDEGRRPVNLQKINSKESLSLHLVKNGQPYKVDEDIALGLLKQENIYIYLNLGQGDNEATMWTCDFSTDYVHINADYRS